MSVGRKTSQSFRVSDARLTIGLQAQPSIIQEFNNKSGKMARGIGYFARFLLSWPESTQGKRFFQDPPENWPKLEKHNARISSIINKELRFNEYGKLDPLTIEINAHAKETWIKLHDRIEKQLSSSGEYADIKDVASKTADNAARIAVNFHALESDIQTPISNSTMEAACTIAEWHLRESLKFFNLLALPEEISNAIAMEAWILDCCRMSNTKEINRRDTQRTITPTRLRKPANFSSAVDILCENNRLKIKSQGKQKILVVNPDLLDTSK
ncbi:MAG: DUF3987 domain-containing protein [Oligoflexales bacterium]